MTSKKYSYLKRGFPPLMLFAIGLFCVMGNYLEKLPSYNPFQNNASTERALQAEGNRRLAYSQETSPLPAWTNKFANVWEPFDKATGDTPIFWYSAKVCFFFVDTQVTYFSSQIIFLIRVVVRL